ncbi:LCP family protein [Agromyces sp. SYSU K20354]|uniref:LCP family protein n=1 Tax=Agromyces cavernae TaxID=2898659 RepID=UPI001E4506ED|nr:LCP family protein [Agromyces cavernae]MCD2443564.1 LCP family protein [Agromyces cavernae]
MKGDARATGAGAEAAEPPRHGRVRRRSGVSTYLKLAASVIAVLAVSAAAVVAYAAVDLVRTVQQKPTVTLANEEILEGAPDIGAIDGGLTFLLVGSDKRPADGSFGDPDIDSAVLNDVTMLVHLSQDHSHVEVVSFPRDMLVSVPECPDPADSTNTLSALFETPLNGVLGYGGLACVALTIEQLTGVKIPVGGVVEFQGVAALAEAVGGIEVCLADPVDDIRSGLHLAAGKHVITGYTALAFLRTRHGVGDGSDLGRIASQQTFLASLARTMQASGTLGDPVKLYSIAKVILSNVQLSNAMQNPVTLVAIARALQAVDLGRITFVQYPTVYTSDLRYVTPSASAAAVNLALQQDLPLAVNPNATTDAPFGTIPDPTPPAPTTTPGPLPPLAPEPAVPLGPEPSPEASATSTPTPTPTVPPATLLPDDVTGLTADEVRCATANPG